MPLNKQQLLQENVTNFPNNNDQLITPQLLREFNADMIDAMQLTQSMSEYAVLNGGNTFVGNQTMTGNLNVSGIISASVLHVQYETASVIFSTGSNQLGDELTDIQTLSGSVKIEGQLLINGIPLTSGSTTNTGSLVTTASFNAYTSSNNQRVSSLEANTASVNTSITNLNSFTASQSSLNGTFATTGSNTFTGNQIIDKTKALYTNALYWTSSEVGYTNLEIINQGGGNLDFASLNGGKMRVVSTPLILTGSAISSSNDISTSANIYGANLTGSTINTASLVTTASFNAYTQSNDTIVSSLVITTNAQQILIGNLNVATQSLFSSASLALTTASFSGNTLTFTKGNGTTFGVVIPDVSGSTIPSGTVSGSAQIVALGFATTASLNAYTASTDSSISQLNASSASQQVSIDALNTNSASVNVSITNLNSTTSSFATSIANLNSNSASVNTSITNLNASSASQQVSIDALNTFTASQSTASIVTSINNLNTFSASALVSISNINSTTASLNTSVNNLNAATSSYANSASVAVVDAAQQQSINSLNAATSSYVTESETASFARTNVDNNFSANQTFTNITATSASITYLTTLYETASVIYSSGSNQLGDELTDIQTLSGSVRVQGSLTVNGTPVLTSSVDISGLVTTASFNAYTQSNDQRVSSLETNSASVNTSITNINSTTASLNTSVTALNTFTASQSTASLVTSIDNLNTFSSSALVSINNLNSTTASLNTSVSNINTFTQSANISINALNAATSSYATSAITASSLITASVSLNTITFTKGDGTTFPITVNTGSGGGGSTNTGSLMVTASASGTANTITFTKGDASTFDVTLNITASASASFDTGSFATTGSNTFNGSQTISGSVAVKNTLSFPNGLAFLGNAGDVSQISAATTIQLITEPPAGPGGTNDIKFINRVSGSSVSFINEQGGAGNNVYFEAGEVIFNAGIRSGSNGNITFRNTINSIDASSTPITASAFKAGAGGINSAGALTASLQQGYAWVGNSSGVSTLVATSSFGGGGTINTGSFATTGSNVFTGSQTYADSGSNSMTLHSISSSLVYTNSDINNFLNVSGAINTANTNAKLGGNLLFKTQNNQSGSLTISGSGNLVMNMPTVFAGFKAQLTSNNLSIVQPSLSASMAFPITISNNILQGTPVFRGPVSSSTWTISSNYFGSGVTLGTSAANHFEKCIAGVSLQNNIINAQINAIANTTNLTSTFSIANSNINQALTINATSSSLQISNSNMGGASATITNRAFHTGSNNHMIFASSLTSGQTTVITSDGAPATNVTHGVVASLLGGSATTIQLGSVGVVSDSMSLRNSIVFGQSLIVTGSNSAAASNTQGSAFLGRYNSTTVGKNDSSYVVFAVGTGTSSTRKTGFLIDSGSNSFFEGSLTISGSTFHTGSLYIQSGSWIPSATGSSILTWNSATGQVSQSPIATLISSSFSVGAFNSTVTQSGSAAVSQSMTFNNTDISNGVSIVSNSQITLANTGTYNIQFSAQLLAGTGADTIWIWLKKNGTNVSNTGTKLVLANNEANVAAWNFVVPAIATDYFELVWQSLDGHTTLLTEAAAGNYPAIPSVILTVTQVE